MRFYVGDRLRKWQAFNLASADDADLTQMEEKRGD
jgi:hypothetical protein